MTAAYKILFELEVTHDYYGTGFCEDLTYKPSNSTEELMNRYNMKIFFTDKGFQFYSTKKNSKQDFLNYLTNVTGQDYFEFYAKTLDESFYSFTKFPVDELGNLVYDTSSSNTETNSIVLKGRFQEDQTANYLFVLRVNFNDITEQSDNESFVNYRIDFVSRKTQWQYNIINSSKQEINQLSVKGDANVEFDTGKEVTLENGEVAICFTSVTDNIPYSQVPKYNFDLVNTIERLGTSKPKTIFKGLPMPNPGQLQVIHENQQTLVLSPTYVYI